MPGSSGGPASRYDGSPGCSGSSHEIGVQRQPQAHRARPGSQHEPSAAEAPRGTGPLALRGERQHPAGLDGDRAIEVGDVHARLVQIGARSFGSADLGGQLGERVLVGGQQPAIRDAEQRRHRPAEGFRVGARIGIGIRSPRIGEERRVLPERLAVGAPLKCDVPAGQTLARVPLALSAVHDPAERVDAAQPFREDSGELALVLAVGIRVPLGAGLALLVGTVERDERGLSPHREAHITRLQPFVDGDAERVDARPLRLRVRLRRAGVFVDADDLVAELERHLDRLRRSLDRGGAGGMRRRAERDVSLAGEQGARRIHADPAGARDVDLGPRVQVGEVVLGAAGPVERLLVGGELHEVARDEPGGEPVLAQQADEQPGTVAARADRAVEGLVGRLDAGLHAHVVGDVAVDGRVEAGEELHRRHAALGQRWQRLLPDAGLLAAVDRTQVRRQVGLEVRLVVEREVLRRRLDEEVERVDHHEVGHEAHRDREVIDPLGEHEPGHPVAERVLLPVHEVVRRADLQGVGLDGRARVRRRPQTHHVGGDIHRSGERVPGEVRERDLCGHPHSVAQNCCARVSRPHRSTFPSRSPAVERAGDPSGVGGCRVPGVPQRERRPSERSGTVGHGIVVGMRVHQVEIRAEIHRRSGDAGRQRLRGDGEIGRDAADCRCRRGVRARRRARRRPRRARPMTRPPPSAASRMPPSRSGSPCGTRREAPSCAERAPSASAARRA